MVRFQRLWWGSGGAGNSAPMMASVTCCSANSLSAGSGSDIGQRCKTPWDVQFPFRKSRTSCRPAEPRGPVEARSAGAGRPPDSPMADPEPLARQLGDLSELQSNTSSDEASEDAEDKEA